MSADAGTRERPASREDRTARLATLLAELRSLVAEMGPEGRDAFATTLAAIDDATPAREPARRGTFGALAGQFAIGPEFFEPLPDEELRAWGEI